jgi:hypothetical protein
LRSCARRLNAPFFCPPWLGDRVFQLDDADAVRTWFRFRDDAIARVHAKYQHVDFARSVGLHLRFGDELRELHSVVAPPRYDQASLRRTHWIEIRTCLPILQDYRT